MNSEVASFRKVKDLIRGLQLLDSNIRKLQGIGIEEALLLCCLSDNCKCQGNIAEEVGLSFTRASRLLGKMEDKGLLSRRIGTEDRRQMLFSLTPYGQEKLQAVTPLVLDYMQG